MKKPRFFVELLFVVLSFVLVPTAAKAAMWEVPTGLNPGDTFRWVFVTSEPTLAQSSYITYYNNFVNNLVDVEDAQIEGVVGKESIADIEWKAIVSVWPVNVTDYAKVNIGGISYAAIYTPDGTLVAGNTDDLWYNSWGLFAPIDITETGSLTTNSYVWTGTSPDGTPSAYPLGSGTWCTLGKIGESGTRWITWPFAATWMSPNPLYAISEELTVVPVPSALILAATGLLSSTLGLKRLRRKHQVLNQI